jgi:SAM-dependent methyltransferase
MGYAADYFPTHVAAWIDQGWLPKDSRLIDFGAQEFYCDPEDARRGCATFLRRRGVSVDQITSAVGTDGKVSVERIYRAIGIDYLAIDVDEAYGSTFFDLNAFAPPIKWRAVFDFVNNEGTIEHLVNPINAFQVAHELLKVGGVARHSIPLSGHFQHGFFYPTAKFYSWLLGQNRYQLLHADAQVGRSDLALGDPRFRLISEDGSPLSSGEGQFTDVWFTLAYRKTTAVEFRAPFDHLHDAADPEALGERLAETFSAYSRARLTASAQRDPVADAFERDAELQRRRHDHELRLQLLEHEHEMRMHWTGLLRRAWRRLSSGRGPKAGRAPPPGPD